MPAKKKKRATVLVLRTCQSDLTSHGGFRWPEAGAVECQDWQPTKNCGHGLHGLAWGVGDGSLLNYDDDAKWLVVEADADSIVEIDWGKIKFPRGTVVHCGDQRSATDYLLAHGAAGKPVVGALSSSGYAGTSTSGYSGTSTSGDGGTSTSGDAGTSTSGDAGTSTSGDAGTSTSGYRGTSTSGDGGTSTSGYRGTSTSGYAGTSTSGYRGTSTSGDAGTSTSGDAGTSTSGDGGTSTSGYRGTSTSGDGGTSTSGDGGTSTSGYRGTSTSGDGGTSTSGDGGTSTSGDGGTSTSGDAGILSIRWWDGGRYRVTLAYVGEGGVKPNTPYRCDERGKLVEVEKVAAK